MSYGSLQFTGSIVTEKNLVAIAVITVVPIRCVNANVATAFYHQLILPINEVY